VLGSRTEWVLALALLVVAVGGVLVLALVASARSHPER
jgi:uncharacterized integral membrane protein